MSLEPRQGSSSRVSTADAGWSIARIWPSQPKCSAGTEPVGTFRWRLITRAGGLMLVLLGVLEVTGTWSAALAWLQTHWAAGYTLPL